MTTSQMTIDTVCASRPPTLFDFADELPLRQRELLLLLLARPNKPVTFAELRAALYPRYYQGDDSGIRHLIGRVRKNLERGGWDARIDSIPARGYKLVNYVGEAGL